MHNGKSVKNMVILVDRNPDDVPYRPAIPSIIATANAWNIHTLYTTSLCGPD